MSPNRDNCELPRWIETLRHVRQVRAILASVTQITWIERVFLLVDSYQHTFANRSHVKYEFTNTKKLVKKLARIEASSSCRQQFVNVFADCFWDVHTHQLGFATRVCRVKAALNLLFDDALVAVAVAVAVVLC